MDTNITITRREKFRLESKAKQGWKCYFIEREAIFDLQEHREVIRGEVQRVRAGDNVCSSHLKKMLLDLYDKVGEFVDCPVCLESMRKDNTHLPNCGHMICITCKENPAINSCPICRKAY